MSTNEDAMIERLWTKLGGTLICEYRAVEKNSTREARRIDAVILPGGAKHKTDFRAVELSGKDVIVVQAKAKRLGMALMGQALFSPRLIERHGARPIRSIALCGRDDPELRLLLEDKHLYSIDVEIDPMGTAKEPPFSRDSQKLRKHWQAVGGTIIYDYPLTQEYSAEAIILPNAKRAELHAERVSLEGQEVHVIHSRKGRLGMYTMGWAVFSTELLRHQKPSSVLSIVICDKNDSILGPMLKPFPFVRVDPDHY